MSEAETPALWERSLTLFDRWGPFTLLGVSVALSVPDPGLATPDRVAVVGLAAAATVWMIVLHTTAPAERAARPWHAALYLTGLLVLATLLMARHLAFFIFTIIGFFHAGLLRPRPLVFVGVAATSFTINFMTWGGLPQNTAEELGGFIALLVVQTVLIGSGIIGGERLMALSEERRRTVQRLEATLAENEGLHAQLVRQAREAGVHDERQRLAREIHDTLAQGLTGIITQLGAAEQAGGAPREAQRHLDAAARLARQSLDEARRSVHALGPEALERDGLVGALQNLADDWSQHNDIPVEVRLDDGVPLATPVETGLLRVAQEALTNVAKHAGAARVALTVSTLGDQVMLDVRDDGHGFDPSASRNGSFGLTSMRQRVAELGGTLAVESQLGSGTAISATVPTAVEEQRG